MPTCPQSAHKDRRPNANAYATPVHQEENTAGRSVHARRWLGGHGLAQKAEACTHLDADGEHEHGDGVAAHQAAQALGAEPNAPQQPVGTCNHNKRHTHTRKVARMGMGGGDMERTRQHRQAATGMPTKAEIAPVGNPSRQQPSGKECAFTRTSLGTQRTVEPRATRPPAR